MLGWKSLKEGW
jgi:hypothetical protein